VVARQTVTKVTDRANGVNFAPFQLTCEFSELFLSSRSKSSQDIDDEWNEPFPRSKELGVLCAFLVFTDFEELALDGVLAMRRGIGMYRGEINISSLEQSIAALDQAFLLSKQV